VVHRYRKLPIAGSALLGFIISYLLFFQQNPSYFILEGTLLFFIFVMVCEPKTSPVSRAEQILYGALVGSLVPLGMYFHFIEASLIAVLIGNLYVSRRFLVKILTSFQQPKEPNVAPLP
jgi:Na+-translocating ferredoxin:NAD+ oxidoreductase RnfD subunit